MLSCPGSGIEDTSPSASAETKIKRLTKEIEEIDEFF